MNMTTPTGAVAIPTGSFEPKKRRNSFYLATTEGSIYINGLSLSGEFNESGTDFIRNNDEELKSEDVVVRNMYVDDVSLNVNPGDGSGPVRIEICVIFLKIGEIDTLKEQYEAEVLIKSRWREPAFDRNRTDVIVTHPINFSSYWNPKLFIENTIGEPKEHAFSMVTYNDKMEAYVQEKRRVKGVFLENLELKDFPFDVQDLTVTIMSERTTLEVELVQNPEEMHCVHKQSFVDEQEWRLFKCVDTEIIEMCNEYTDPNVKRVAMMVKCRAARRPAYFVWNIFLITFLICSLVFATFSVERTLPQNRLQLSFTLVLTSVAFKFVVNQSLPKISYLTYLDKYVLASMILLTGVCMWHAISSAIKLDEKTGDTVEAIALGLILSIYVVFNAAFIIRIYLLPGRKRRDMKRKENDYLERIHRLAERKRYLMSHGGDQKSIGRNSDITI